MLHLKSIRVFILIAALCLNSSVMKSAMFTRSVKMPAGFNASVLMDAVKDGCSQKLDNVSKIFADIDKEKIAFFVSTSALQAKETAVNNPQLSAILGVSCLFVLIQTFLPAEKRLYYQDKLMNFLREKYERIPYPIRCGSEFVFSLLSSLKGKQVEGEEAKKTRFDLFKFNNSLFQSLVIAFGGKMAGWPSIGYPLAGGLLVYHKFTDRFDRTDKIIVDGFNTTNATIKANHTEAMAKAKELEDKIDLASGAIETCKKVLLDDNGKLRTEATQNTTKITQHVTQIHSEINKNIDALKEQMITFSTQTDGKIDCVASNVKQLAVNMKKVLLQHGEFKALYAGLSQEISGIDAKQEELNVYWKTQLSELSAKIDAQSELRQIIDTVLHNQKTLEENLNAKFAGLEQVVVQNNNKIRTALESQAVAVSNDLKKIVSVLEKKDIKNAETMNQVLSKSQAACDSTKNLVTLFSEHKLEVSGTLNELVESHKKVEALIDRNLKAMSDFAARQDKADERIGRMETVQEKLMEELKSLQKKNEAMQVAMLELTHLLKTQETQRVAEIKRQAAERARIAQQVQALSEQFEDAAQSVNSNIQVLKTEVAKNTQNDVALAALVVQQGQQIVQQGQQIVQNGQQANQALHRIEQNQLERNQSQQPSIAHDPNFVMPINTALVKPGSFGRGSGTPARSLALNWLSQ